MRNYNVPAAQNIYMQMLSQYNYPLNDSQQALLFAKALQYQNGVDPSNMIFATDNEFFVSFTPTGYAVTGYYDVVYPNGMRNRVPFNVTVQKVNGMWYPSTAYVAADTKRGSNFIATWLLLMLGCGIIGLASYFVLSAIIGF